jgi:excisionase family DNA binding protein
MRSMTQIDVMTTNEACERLGIGLRRLQVLLAEGKIPGSFKLGLQRLIPRKAVEARVRQVDKWRAGHAHK